MIPLLTREAARAIDQHAIDTIGIPGIVLMENAGRGAYESICARYGHALGRVVVVGGPGQNGGDGWVIARHLQRAGHSVHAILVGDEAALAGDARTNWLALGPLGVEHLVVPPQPDALEPLQEALADATLIVDGLFGTGLDRPIEGAWAKSVLAINRRRVPTVALDLPSGIDANLGGVLGVAVRADLTVTFAAHKRGLHQHPGVDHAGEVVLADIGVPVESSGGAHLAEPDGVARLLPERRRDAHKGTSGHVLVVAGSPGKMGAGMLSALGALRGGAGLVTLAPRGGMTEHVDVALIEVMTAPLPASGAGERLMALLEGKRSLVIGPGLGLDREARDLVQHVALHAPIGGVIDADALTLWAELGLSGLREASGVRVLTPHPGEAGRLLGVSSLEVQADRYGAATQLAAESQQVVVLKGARTIVAAPDGRLRVCRRGTPALGVGGTGDVLAGLIGALLGSLDPLDAATAGVVLHAIAGEIAATSDRGLMAGEVAHALPAALEKIRRALRET